MEYTKLGKLQPKNLIQPNQALMRATQSKQEALTGISRRRKEKLLMQLVKLLDVILVEQQTLEQQVVISFRIINPQML
jgi:acetolactate synthase regulatory subunit